MVAGSSSDDHALTVLTGKDERAGFGPAESRAYPVTIHRSQGSEYTAAVISLTMGPL